MSEDFDAILFSFTPWRLIELWAWGTWTILFFFPNNWNFDNFAERSWRAVSLIIDFRQSCNLPKRWRRRGRVAMTRWQTGLGRCFCERLCLCFLGAIELWWCFSERLFLYFRRDWASLRTVRWRPLRSLQTAPLSGSPSFKEINMKM